MHSFLGKHHLQMVFPFIFCGLLILEYTSAAETARITPSYKALVRPKIPSDTRALHNPIDAFWKASLNKAGIIPAQEADKRTLLRRLHMDMTGLPPKSEEVQNFLNDESPDAYEKVVEKLLASPAFGEHWGQQWLDLVRYSDSEGFKIDRIRPDAWKFRNWVIQSFNDDLPYDKFISWQIAGDEIAPESKDARIATGFLRLAPEESNGADYTQIRQDILNDVTDVTAQAFLGLTLGCARCHNHKFDPIRQEEYFQFQAFFSGILYPDAITLSSISLTPSQKGIEEKALSMRKDLALMMQEHEKNLFEEIVVALDPQTQIALKTPPEKRTVTQSQLATLASKQIDRRKTKLYRRLKPEQRTIYDKTFENLASLAKELPIQEAYMGVSEKYAKPPATFRLAQGDVRKPKEEVQPGFPLWIEKEQPRITALANSSGRRTALAKWLTQPDHPLTSRVIVNRIWQGYFGAGLVANSSDFGKASEPYHQPEILDWLASDLVRNQYSLKSIHRLIANSSPYKLASKVTDQEVLKKGNQIDPENNLVWHAEVRRLSAEQVRDAILHASGDLNSGMHEGVVRFALPASLINSRYAWTKDEAQASAKKRSIYLIQRRNMPNPSLEAFDFPDRNLSCAIRNDTVTAVQALALLNDPEILDHAQNLAANIMQKAANNTHLQIQTGFLAILKRSPDSKELEQSKVFIEVTSAAVDPLERLTDLLHALLNTSEFLELE
ncbi:MAG: DUF1549 and DUF1553 domain-containing protein [Planctomycetota bacterium]|nr:DUF1549 and DUF1553 domain-containing protein [Planctomycetota bacterium]